MKPTQSGLQPRINCLFQTASLLLAMLYCFSDPGYGQITPQANANSEAANKARAESILKQTRDALGGEANLSAIKSLAINGEFRTVMGGREIKGDIKIEMLLPDKYQRTIKTNTGQMTLTRIDTANGAEAWRDQKRDMNMVSTGDAGGFASAGASGGGGLGGDGGGGAVGTGGGGATGRGGGGGFGGGGRGGRGGGGGFGGGPANGGGGGIIGEASPETQRQIKEDYSRMLIAFLAGTPAASSFDYTYDRELDAKDGKVDVIRITGKDEFVVWMMVDRIAKRPRMLVYRALAPRAVVRTSNQSPTIVGEGNAEDPKLMDYQLFLGDYKQEGSVWMPHQIVRVVNNQPQEEWKVTKVKFNQDIKANKFEKKK
ncbi:MAG: hypothetical protein JST85_05350 [Acidobacteria bacterium]|nr:hypothetical protein [Acidobacteriota bacterium]